jgi:hypothetical protein
MLGTAAGKEGAVDPARLAAVKKAMGTRAEQKQRFRTALIEKLVPEMNRYDFAQVLSRSFAAEKVQIEIGSPHLAHRLLKVRAVDNSGVEWTGFAIGHYRHGLGTADSPLQVEVREVHISPRSVR